eukprot:4318414-Alexandrium_andersonii.AAC.1
MRSPAVPTMATGGRRNDPSGNDGKCVARGSLWPSSGQRGSACEASVWRACGGATLHARTAQ